MPDFPPIPPAPDEVPEEVVALASVALSCVPRAPRHRGAPGENASASEARGARPSNWDKRMSVGFLRILGATQREAANAVGISERTVRTWEHEASWPDAIAEARSRWLDAAGDRARRALWVGLGANDQASARWVLERVEPALAAPVQRTEVTGANGGPLGTMVQIYLPENLRELRERLVNRLGRLVPPAGPDAVGPDDDSHNGGSAA